MMKNSSGVPVPTEQEAIGNISREQNRYIRQIVKHMEKTLSLLGFELLDIRIQDRNSRKIYGWHERK